MRGRSYDMSALEREYELEMDDSYNGNGSHASTTDDEEFEVLLEHDVEDDYEVDSDPEEPEDYASRFFELSQREFESESEVDEAVNDLLAEMEQEFFWGSLKKKIKSGLKKLPLKKIVARGVQLAKSHVPALQAVTALSQLSRGNLKGMIGSLAKAGLGAAVPGAAPFLPAALKGLGFEAAEDPADNREAWNNLVDVARESYEYLASNMHEDIDDPVEAGELANRAFEAGVTSVQSSVSPRAARGLRPRGAARGARGRVIELAPGEQVVIRMRRS